MNAASRTRRRAIRPMLGRLSYNVGFKPLRPKLATAKVMGDNPDNVRVVAERMCTAFTSANVSQVMVSETQRGYHCWVNVYEEEQP